ncbi:MAG TPA: hypothetical protein VKT81_24805 [Bryobacteraceae bacterium]|nr:hypothetical protein [Bryobacteraceae bacterium]
MIQDLGSLPDMPACTGTAISQSGNVAGYCSVAGGSVFLETPTHGFLYSKGTLTDIKTSSKPTVPTGVNDSGSVVGAYVNINLAKGIAVSPFLFQNGAIQPFAGAPNNAAPFGLTNAGQSAATQILEGGYNFFAASEAFLITGQGNATPLVAMQSGQSTAFGISPSGDWVAGAFASIIAKQLASLKAGLWHAGVFQALPLASNFNYASATAVNDAGTAAGIAFTFDFAALQDPHAAMHAVIFSNGGVTDLGTLSADRNSAAAAINNSGTVVGFSTTQTPDITLFEAPVLETASALSKAIVYTNGTMYDLNRLLINGSGWQLNSATGINDAGQIVGTGTINQQQHAFLLTPIVLPQISAVVGGGLHTPPVNAISDDALFTIFGTGFTDPSVMRNVTGSDLTNNALPTNLANVCVQGGNAEWGIIYVSATQINAVAHPLTTSGNVPITVVTNCGQPNALSTAAFNVAAAAETPQFFFGLANDIAVNQASDGAPVTSDHPAHAGDILTAYGTGWGTTMPAAVVGSLAAGAADITGKYTLTIGDKTADVSYAGLSPTYAGLYQINFTVPAGLTAGDQPIVLTINGVPTPTGAMIPVQ